MKKEIKSDITTLSEHDRKVLDKYSSFSYSLIENQATMQTAMSESSKKRNHKLMDHDNNY